MSIPGIKKRIDIITFPFSLLVTVVVLLFISNSTFAKTEVLFSPRGSIKDTIIKTINSSEETIDITAFTFTAGDIAEALFNAKERGIKIRIIIDRRQDQRHYQVIEFLKEEGFELQFLKGNIGGSMNNTFAIFDGKLLVTGSYNWTEYAEKFNYENALFIDEPDVIEKYKKEYESLYDEGIEQEVRRRERLESHSVSSETGVVSTSGREEALTGSGNVIKAKGEIVKGPVSDVNVATSVAGNVAEHIDTPVSQKQVNIVDQSGKQFLPITFIEFDSIFGSESKLEQSEKKRLWKEEFEGKYVSWTGKIGFKGISVYDWNKVGIIQNGSKIDVNLKFDWTKQGKLKYLNVGDVVTYTGRLIAPKSLLSPYRLDDVDLFQVR